MILAPSFVSFGDVTKYSYKLCIYIVEKGSNDVLNLYKWFKNKYLIILQAIKKSVFVMLRYELKNNIPRTTNSLEGYHRHLNTFINLKQTSILLILNELKNEQAITENKIFLPLYKEIEPKEDQVKKLIMKYKTLSPIDYLMYIALNFN
ncbi:hypothetical protein DMUE_0139 [Dictyocoela muelleri]|nr:hypothetical protein DMUE_0139 [Dictyocoela muelleri]